MLAQHSANSKCPRLNSERNRGELIQRPALKLSHVSTAILLAARILASQSGDAVAAPQTEVQGLPLSLVQQPWTGDFDGMVKRRRIRVLVVNSKTFYFVDKGTPRGITYDSFKAVETAINKKLKTKHIEVYVAFIPVRRDRLIPYLVEGKGDIAVANLTVTPERQKLVDFTAPVIGGISEIVVTGPRSPPIATVAD